MNDDERRANPNPMDVAGALAILYTGVFAATVLLLLFVEMPAANKEPLLQLFGLMSAIQMAIVAFYYGSSKSGEATQRAIEQRTGRAEAVVQEIAKAMPAAVPATTPAAPMKVENVEIDAKTVHVDESPQPTKEVKP